MATAYYTVRVETYNGYGYMEYEIEIDVPNDFHEDDMSDQAVYDEIMQNLGIDFDFNRLEDVEED